MMSNNKILTVSYGTFSCTLEGFDDSFGTMKAIAEYFRGLSSDAPYFGAEPPQPDAEMLARIAQKEISRRVEAREHEGKIHLSAIENRVEQDAVAPQDLNSDEETAAKADTTKPTAAIVAPSALAEAAPTAEDDAPAVEDAPTPVDTAKRTPINTPVPDFVEDENDIVPGQPDADVEAFFANAKPTVADTDEDQDIAAQDIAAQDIAPAATPVAPQDDSIAAKLQRIRAVVARHDDIEDDADFLEDEHAENSDTYEDASENLIADARHDIEDALDADDAVDELAAAQGDNDQDDDDDIAAILGRLDAADAAEVEELNKYIEAVSQTSDDTDDSINNLFGADDDADDQDDPDDQDADDDDDDMVASDDAAPVADDVEEAVEAAPKEAPRARVIKVKRADLEAAIAKGELEEYGNDQDESQQEAAVPTLDDLAPARNAQSSLSAEDEAELARELTALEADMAPEKSSQDDDDEDTAEDKEQRQAAGSQRRVLPSIDDAKGDDMDRLLAETDQLMDEPESATRRDAFNHLRAAVAAKKADVALGASDKSDDESDGEYRNDLAEVVRPRRAVNGSARTERPGDARPAPLKLVAEQRIDVAQPRPAGPVRPRRVAAVTEAASQDPDGDSFADYAAEMGATKLPQLLEAAAAYMSFVEGREQFSRPQLMTKVRQVGPEEGFSREDGLRSFGQLLRAGKIEKIKGGRFTVSEDIGYRPDHRAAG